MVVYTLCLILGIFGTCFSHEACYNKQIDIVFVIHASSGAGKDNLHTQLQFVRNITDRFDIGPQNIQVSVVTYASDVYNEFFLNTYQNKSDLDKALDRINVTYRTGDNHIEKALDYVRLNSFKAENSGRKVTKVVLVLLEGDVAELTETRRAAAKLHHIGAKVIAIGIGSGLGFRINLEAIPSDHHYSFPLSNLEELSSLQAQIENITCSIPDVCGDRPADIVFVLDSSSSVGATNFQKQLDFVADFEALFDIGPSDVLFGLVSFTRYAYNELYLNSYTTDKPFLLSKIRSVQYRHGRSTAVAEGLDAARRYQFVSYRGAREGSNKVVIVIMEGESSDIAKTLTAASLLKTQGIQIIAVGIGRYVRTYELYNLASDQYHAFHISSYDNLTALAPNIVTKACGVGETAHVPEASCGGKTADIVFVLDSSISTGAYNFSRQLTFMRDFAYQFAIGPHAIQISIVTFSDRAHEQFALNAYDSQTSLMNAIVRLSVINSGSPHTDQALSFVRQNSFLHSKGARNNAKKIVVVISNGQSTEPNKTAFEVPALRKSGNIAVVAVGVGSGVNKTEMRTIASDPAYMLSVTDFDALQTATSTLAYVACQSCGFLSLADIVLVLGASSSEGALGYQKQIDAVARLVNDFQIGPDNVQIALVTFSDTAHAQFYLNLWHLKIQVLAGIQRARYSPGATNIDKALQYVRETLFIPKNGDRREAKNYVILVTDESPSDFNRTVVQADLLKQQNAEILVIGIGTNVHKAELDQIASDSTYAIMKPNFDSLKTVRGDVKAAICEGISAVA